MVEDFPIESTRHLARRRGRVAGHGVCGVLTWLVLLLREAHRFGVSRYQFKMVAKIMIKGATAPSATRVAEPAWRTLKLFFTISNENGLT